MRRAGLIALALGVGWSALCVTAIIPHYAGTAVSPFTARYAELGGTPGQVILNLLRVPGLYGEVLSRPRIAAMTTGGWLGRAAGIPAQAGAFRRSFSAAA